MLRCTPCRSLKYRPIPRHDIKLDSAFTPIPFNASMHSPQTEDTNLEVVACFSGATWPLFKCLNIDNVLPTKLTRLLM
ncbi:hypothetical protein M405DRAFT_805839 [Rhizopogon salebrosus TDB-379]|nr:hypothetical protein M405DRAFT_805839 [Rhizopogon salebrosus TDB-379]